VGDEHLPEKYINKLENTIMSPSSFRCCAGLDDSIDLEKLDLDYPYNVVSTGLGTAERLFDAFLPEIMDSRRLLHAAVICPSLTTKTKNTVPFGSTPWGPKWMERTARKQPLKKYQAERKWADFLIDIQRVFYTRSEKNL